MDQRWTRKIAVKGPQGDKSNKSDIFSPVTVISDDLHTRDCSSVSVANGKQIKRIERLKALFPNGLTDRFGYQIADNQMS